ncbi:hypothetical protein [Robbsia sp. KACC 23696]|uniref:hypothetical protein n=1 Tax=Robbsia sp. KACC 23696 TaxID=3149231 RepID=UPI00325AA3D6
MKGGAQDFSGPTHMPSPPVSQTDAAMQYLAPAFVAAQPGDSDIDALIAKRGGA